MSAQQIIDGSRTYADGWVTAADSLVSALTASIAATEAVGAIDGQALSETASLAAKFALDDKYNVVNTLKTTVAKLDEFTNTDNIGDVQFVAAPAWNAGSMPTAVEFDPGRFKVPEFNGTVPTVNFGSAPSALTSTAPVKPSDVRPIEIPTDFSVNIPTAPVLSGSVNLPSAPTITFPAYLTNVDWDMGDDVGEANFTFAFNDEAYQSAMLDEVKAKLMHDIAYGGYGIETADEVGLWERARERESSAAEAEMRAVTRDFAARGFMVPPGSLFGAIEGIRAKAMAAAATMSREVALKRSDLYVQNRQFTIQQIQALETTLINQHMAVMERILKAAQVSAQVVVDQYRARLDKARLNVDVIQARVQSFREMVAAEATKIEVYSSQIKGELAKTEVDKNKLEAYRAQLAGVESTVAVYRLQVQAAEAAVQAERSKVEMWKAEVDGYLATVKAKESEFSGYESRIRGEQAKVQVFGEQVKAHTAMVDAKRVEADIKSLEVKAYAESANVALRAFEAELSANKAANDLLSRSEEVAVRALGAKIDAYRAGVDASGKLASTQLDQSRLVVQSQLDSTKLMLEGMLSGVDTLFKYKEMGTQTQFKLIDLYKDMISAALGGLNSIASISE